MFDFIAKYGNLTFEEKKFTEIDAAIFSCLLYLDLDEVVSSRRKMITLQEAFTRFCTKKNEKIYNKRIYTMTKTFEMARMIKDLKRYKDIQLYHYVYKYSHDEQFSAMCMKLNADTVFIGFEGTDERMSGWKEDLEMTYHFPVAAQKDAIAYLNSSISFADKNIFVGGHSKGGHLALVASMYAFPLLRLRIKEVYNFDGPGLRKREMQSLSYRLVAPKLHLIVPNDSIFGLMLRHTENIRVVQSKTISFWAHSPYTWLVIEDEFKSGNLTKMSRKLEKSLNNWLDHHNDVERKRMVDGLFSVFETSGIEKATDIPRISSIISLVRQTRLLDEETKTLLINFIKMNMEYLILRKERK